MPAKRLNLNATHLIEIIMAMLATVITAAAASNQKYCNAANVDLVLYNPLSAPAGYQNLPTNVCQDFASGNTHDVIYEAMVIVPTTLSPSFRPTVFPTGQPSGQPSAAPSHHPFLRPTSHPSRLLTDQPSHQPTSQPSTQPTDQPTGHPAGNIPTGQPSRSPTGQPSDQPSSTPTGSPTQIVPTSYPTTLPTSLPTDYPVTWLNVGDFYVGISNSVPQVYFDSTRSYSEGWQGLVCLIEDTSTCGGENRYNLYLNTTENLLPCPAVTYCPEDNNSKPKMPLSAAEIAGIVVGVIVLSCICCCISSCKDKGSLSIPLLGGGKSIWADDDNKPKRSALENVVNHCMGRW